MTCRNPIGAALPAAFLAAFSSPAGGQAAGSHDGTCEASATSFEHVWTHTGSWWIGEQVSLGNHGTQVFTHYHLNDTAAALLSIHDGDPPLPAWELDTDPDDPQMVDSATWADVHVGITQTETGTNNQRIIKLSKYDSAGLDWVYTYPYLTAGRLIAAVSEDGATILAAVGNPMTGLNDVLIFTPDSSVPVATFSMPAGTMWNFDLAADGNRAVFAIHTTMYVVDLPSGNTVFTRAESASYSNRGVAISGDGSILASGTFMGGLLLFEWDGSTYVQTWSHPTPSGIHEIDISDDSSTVAYGIGFVYPSTRIITECVDIATKTVTMSEDISSYGQYQNTVADVAISANGEVFATATFGDEPNVVEEVRIYQKHHDAPLWTLNLPGSAFNVDISPDGKWVVAGSKAVHANVSGHGGRVDLLHLGGSDFAMHTTPSIGNTVSFTVYGAPGSPAFLLDAADPALPPLVFPSLGTLYLDRSQLSVTPLRPIGPGGSSSASWTIPSDGTLIGTTHSFQGFLTRPRKLTRDWLPVTYLP